MNLSPSLNIRIPTILKGLSTLWKPVENTILPTSDGAEQHGTVEADGGMERVVWKTKKEELRTVMIRFLSVFIKTR